eukprot:3710258-Rhodomonas_salina.1
MCGPRRVAWSCTFVALRQKCSSQQCNQITINREQHWHDWKLEANLASKLVPEGLPVAAAHATQ